VPPYCPHAGLRGGRPRRGVLCPALPYACPTAAQASALLSEMGEKSLAVWLQVGEDRGDAIMGRCGMLADGRTSCPMVEVGCVGCEAMVAGGEGPSHPYMLSAAGCWEQYCSLEEWKSRLSGEESIGIVQNLVDSFAVQHATNTDRRNVQSVAVHPMSLCSGLERDATGRQRRARIGRWVGRDYPVLDPRPAGYPITISDVADAPAATRPSTIERLAQTAWSAWSAHHDTVRAWLDDLG
jgi:hypothetical protein